ncbi:hypothetical protein SH668x_001281 [Planctomicrobium sp. SH668]|uniref:hypothetical protein n=1 Tax=Planctomicrobium sp. SH668 TaxID=3448126 RepID=UPI003F5B85EF
MAIIGNKIKFSSKWVNVALYRILGDGIIEPLWVRSAWPAVPTGTTATSTTLTMLHVEVTEDCVVTWCRGLGISNTGPYAGGKLTCFNLDGSVRWQNSFGTSGSEHNGIFSFVNETLIGFQTANTTTVRAYRLSDGGVEWTSSFGRNSGYFDGEIRVSFQSPTLNEYRYYSMEDGTLSRTVTMPEYFTLVGSKYGSVSQFDPLSGLTIRANVGLGILISPLKLVEWDGSVSRSFTLYSSPTESPRPSSVMFLGRISEDGFAIPFDGFSLCWVPEMENNADWSTMRYTRYTGLQQSLFLAGVAFDGDLSYYASSPYLTTATLGTPNFSVFRDDVPIADYAFAPSLQYAVTSSGFVSVCNGYLAVGGHHQMTGPLMHAVQLHP